jgi:hypothetical protein
VILARIYMGDNAGGPVDYSTPFGETAADSIALPPLWPGGSRRVAIRFFDSDTGLEELNTDASIILSVSDDGMDVSVVPAPPAGLAIRETGTGAALITWQYNLRAGDNVPEYWYVYVKPGEAVDWSSPEGLVPYDANATRYSYQIAGYPAGAPVAIAVESRKGNARNPNSVQLVWTPTARPGAATRLSGIAVDSEV